MRRACKATAPGDAAASCDIGGSFIGWIAEVLQFRYRQAGQSPALHGVLIPAPKPGDDGRDMGGERVGKT